MRVGDRVRVRKDAGTAHDPHAPCPWRQYAGVVAHIPGTIGTTSTTLRQWECDVQLDGAPVLVGFDFAELQPE